MVSVHKIIFETVSLLETVYREGGIRMDVNVIPGEDRVRGSVGGLQQIITTLLSNAHKALVQQRDGHVIISTLKTPTSLWVQIDILRVEVSDRMGSELQYGRDALRNVIETDGGTYETSRLDDGGTRFRLVLPWEVPVAPRTGRMHFPKLSGRILVVDDEPDIRMLLGIVVQGWGIDADIVEGGRKAIDCLSQRPGYDVLLTDLLMPEMSGAELLKQVDSIVGPEMKRVVMTGAVGTKTYNEVACIVDACLVKPFDKKAVYDVLAMFLKPASSSR